ncbi:MAG: DoxX family protein [Bacteroidota bacterium]|nr:DoxX family protein [Bacteroidota bacterium]
MKPKTIKIIYWISTGLIALFVLPGIFFLNSTMALEGTRHLGMPHWFHMELGIGKFIGALILIIPMIPSRIKEWAYVAFGIDSISASIGLFAVDGALPSSFEPIIFFVILVTSYICFHKIKSGVDYKNPPYKAQL